MRWGILSGACQVCTASVGRAVNGFVSVTEEQSHKGPGDLFHMRVSPHADHSNEFVSRTQSQNQKTMMDALKEMKKRRLNLHNEYTLYWSHSFSEIIAYFQIIGIW